MPIPALPLFKHRDTVVTPADQNQFVTQFETTMDTMSNDVIPAINLATTDINEKVIIATTARDESEDARDIAVSAKDEALTAVATLQEGAIDDTTIAPNKAFSNQYTNDNFVKLTGNQTIEDVKTFTASPIVPVPTLGSHAVNKDYIDNLRTIAIGTATFTATTNNINLTGIGVGVEIGDVIQITGSTNNNDYYTIEVITDNNNIIVNQAHANKSLTYPDGKRTKTLNTETSSVTIKLASKYYNAPLGLGQDWVDVLSSRTAGTIYQNLTNRAIKVATVMENQIERSLYVNGIIIAKGGVSTGNIVRIPLQAEVGRGSKYNLESTTLVIIWKEFR